MSHYTLIHAPPGIEAYRHLRANTGLSTKTLQAAQIGLANTWFGVHLLCENETVGMGRIIGDGGCHFQVVDIAVLPQHQGKGLGKKILAALMEYYDRNAPESAYLSLIADGKAKELYSQFGFVPTAPRAIGMRYGVRPDSAMGS